MFTGIITQIGRVSKIQKIENCDLVVNIILDKTEIKRNFNIGCSISCNGICLTLVKKEIIDNIIDLQFQASNETISKTNISNWSLNDSINIEFALRVGDELGGHMVSGHIDGVSKVVNIKNSNESKIFKFEILGKKLIKHISRKGSITINGTSLTVNNVYNNFFDVNIIPHTFNNTNFSEIKINDIVNIEIDMFSKYIENLLNNYERS